MGTDKIIYNSIPSLRYYKKVLDYLPTFLKRTYKLKRIIEII
jgi:hypothetical protein